MVFPQQIPSSFILNTHAPENAHNTTEHGQPATVAVAKFVTRCLPATLLPGIAEPSRTPKRVGSLSRRMVRIHIHSITARAILLSHDRRHLKSESTLLSLSRNCRRTVPRMPWTQSLTPASSARTQLSLTVAANKTRLSRPAVLHNPQLKESPMPLTRRTFVE